MKEVDGLIVSWGHTKWESRPTIRSLDIMEIPKAVSLELSAARLVPSLMPIRTAYTQKWMTMMTNLRRT